MSLNTLVVAIRTASMNQPFFNTTFFQSFIAGTVATVIGVIVGIPIALWVNRYIELSSRQEHKRKILQVLINELVTNKSVLDDYMSNYDLRRSSLPPKLRYESWKAFSDGGELQWINDPDLLGLISTTYYSIRLLLDLYEKMFRMKSPYDRYSLDNQPYSISSSINYDIENFDKLVTTEFDNTYNTILSTLEKLKSQLGKTP